MRLLVASAASAFLFLTASPALADTLHSSTFGSGLVAIETSDASAAAVGSDGTVARAAAFDRDGTLYTTVNNGRFLGTFDLSTGAVTLVGPLLSTGMMDAIEIDASGELYGVTGAGAAYRIDKSTGAPTLLSQLGLTNVQDLAYDPAGTLWAVSLNRLFVIDVQTGVKSLVGTIGGDRQGNVFGISFDADGRLWATSTVSDAPLYEITLGTLAARLVGRTGVNFPRGCDIYVAHAPEEAPPPPDADGDGVLDEVDAFPNSDLRPTVHVGDTDTEVDNLLFPDGATIADLVVACAQDAVHPGDFVHRAAHLATSLRKDGWITGAEQGRLQRAVAAFHRSE